MKCDLVTTRMLSHASYHGSPVDIAVLWRCAPRTTIYSSVSMAITFEIRTWRIGLFQLSAIRYEYGRPLSTSSASSNVVLGPRKTFSRDQCPICPRPVVRRRPSGTPLMASPVYLCIYSHFRRTPRWEVSTGLQLCFSSIVGRNSPTSSISIGSRSTNGFRGVGTPDSCSPHRDTLEKPVSGQIDFHWFPVDQWVSRCLDLRFEFPTSNYPSYHRYTSQLVSLPVMFFWPGYKQTNNHLFRKTLLSVEGISRKFDIF